MAIRSEALVVLMATLGAGLVPPPAEAQTGAAAALDPLVFASRQVDSGMALARRQADSGDLAAALATVERVMLAHPEAVEARLVHVVLLCRIDDPEGARSELEQLAGHPVSDRSWADVTAACGAMPRPAAVPADNGTEGGR
jgi:hypothetical protein